MQSVKLLTLILTSSAGAARSMATLNTTLNAFRENWNQGTQELRCWYHTKVLGPLDNPMFAPFTYSTPYWLRHSKNFQREFQCRDPKSFFDCTGRGANLDLLFLFLMQRLVPLGTWSVESLIMLIKPSTRG